MPTICIVGNGCIGVTCGVALGALTPSTRQPQTIRFLSRPSAELDQLKSANRLELILPDGKQVSFTPQLITSDPCEALKGVDLVLISTKRQANASVAPDIARFAPASVNCIMLQNGLKAAEEFQKLLHANNRPDIVCSNAVVHFNAVKLAVGKFKWVTSFADTCLVFDANYPATVPLAQAFCEAGLDSYCDADFTSIACGKLIVNLVNAVNALSGTSTRDLFVEEGYKNVWAASIAEALHLMALDGITPRSPRDLENGRINNLHYILRLPSWVLRLYLYVSGRQVDGKSSMLQDLEAKRDTEIDYLTGYVSSWGRRLNVPTPVADRLVELVKQAEQQRRGSPQIPPDVLWEKVMQSKTSD